MLAQATTRGVYDDLARVYVPVACVVFLLVLVALLVVAVRDRSGRDRPADRVIARPRVEAAFVVTLVVVAGLLVWRSYESYGAENAVGATVRGRGPALTVDVLASRWNWRFSYPGGAVETGNGVARPATLVVPAGRPVRIRLRSADVSHALWIPELKTKYDAMPGRTNEFGLVFPAGLRIENARCSEFCGEYHAQMTFHVRTLAPDDFDAWLQAHRGRTEAPR